MIIFRIKLNESICIKLVCYLKTKFWNFILNFSFMNVIKCNNLNYIKSKRLKFYLE